MVAEQSKVIAKQSNVKPNKRKQSESKARQHKAKESKGKRGKSNQSTARQGKARQGEARQGKARQGKAGQGRARQRKTRQGWASQSSLKTAISSTYLPLCPKYKERLYIIMKVRRSLYFRPEYSSPLRIPQYDRRPLGTGRERYVPSHQPSLIELEFEMI